MAVGYRVRSARGVQFRHWATERLREYRVKGFTMDDERLENPPGSMAGVPDYFDELLERIRDISASEAFLDFVIEFFGKMEGQKGFRVLSWRWVFERIFGWMMRWRRLVRRDAVSCSGV